MDSEPKDIAQECLSELLGLGIPTPELCKVVLDRHHEAELFMQECGEDSVAAEDKYGLDFNGVLIAKLAVIGLDRLIGEQAE